MRFLVGLPAMHWLLATRQRVSRVKDAQLVCFLVRLQLVCYIFLYRFRILPYRCNLSLWTLFVRGQEWAENKRMSSSTTHTLFAICSVCTVRRMQYRPYIYRFVSKFF